MRQIFLGRYALYQPQLQCFFSSVQLPGIKNLLAENLKTQLRFLSGVIFYSGCTVMAMLCIVITGPLKRGRKI